MRPGIRTNLFSAWGRISAPLTELLVSRRLRGVRDVPPFTVVGVYSSRSADTVERLIAGARSVRLWALDELAPPLAEVTVGTGRGGRMQLLNRLLEGVDTEYVVIADDDIAFVAGDIRRLVAIADRHRLDLCQPAQDARGHWVHGITFQRGLSGVRLTNFVEVGPLVVIGPRIRSEIVPFPEDSPTGHGVDVQWMKLLKSHGARLGVVDGAPIMHLRPVGTSYESGRAAAHLDSALQDVGVRSIQSGTRNLLTVRPWQI
jgi:hypothetical protein